MPEYPNAYGNRTRQYLLEVVGITMSDDEFESLRDFVDSLQTQLSDCVAGGVYLNFLEGEEKVRRSSEGFEPEAWLRLGEVKPTIDPSNLFSHGIAIG